VITRAKVPTLSNRNVLIRVATDPKEIRQANWLVFRNYVADGFWENDETQIETNPFLHTPSRTVFVVLEDGKLVGTMSIIEDSPTGLPSDGTQLALMGQLRSRADRLAEVSAFAMDRSTGSRRKLVLFLMSYVLQYSFYHAGIDRFVASCKPGHADFYESMLCFSKVSDLTYYDYSHACGYLVSLNLIEAHLLLSQKYAVDPATGKSLYRFLLCEPQPCHQFSSSFPTKRSRELDWTQLSLRKVA